MSHTPNESAIPSLSDERIDKLWNSLPGIAIHNKAARTGGNTNYAIRLAFARAIESEVAALRARFESYCHTDDQLGTAMLGEGRYAEDDTQAAWLAVQALAAVPGKGEPVATVIKKGADRQWMSESLGSLPDGMYSLYLHPAPVGEVVAWPDLTKLTRLGWSEAYIGDSSELVEDSSGTYVRFADVEALFAALPQDLTGE